MQFKRQILNFANNNRILHFTEDEFEYDEDYTIPEYVPGVNYLNKDLYF